jgi:hypothetical protein
MDGVALIARTAAKRRAKDDASKKTVIHPVAIRYFFRGNLREAVEPMLCRLESHLTWRPKTHLPLLERIGAIGRAMLALKEVEYLGNAQSGGLFDRVEALIENILVPLEEKWKIKDRAGNVVGRVKDLRAAILPDLVERKISEEEREERWQELAAGYYAQQLSHYPRDYITPDRPSVERILETVERLDEDLTGQLPSRGPLHAVLHVGEAIQVDAEADRRIETERIMGTIKSQLQGMLDALAGESTIYAQ